MAISLDNSYVSPTLERKIISYPDFFRFTGSVIPSVITPVIFTTLYTILIIYINQNVYHVNLPNSIVPSLSVVVGLLLVFRTNTAYDRYYEGRRLWTVIKSSIRNLVRGIYMIPTQNNNDIWEKMDVMKYTIAFALATKHYLRDELESRHQELDHLLPVDIRSEKFQPVDMTYGGPTHEPTSLPNLTSVNDFGTKENNVLTQRKFHQSGYGSFNSDTASLKVDSDAVSVNLPIDIIFYINKYVFSKRQSNLIDPQTNNAMNGYLTSLVDSLSGLERIMRTPIPLAYLIHLKQAVTLYLLFLPFTLTELKYYAVPIISIVAFTLYGIDAIGQEIENPFGYDANDLPLDAITNEIGNEVVGIVSKLGQQLDQ
ncbi:UPF0187-domain-containing protein [Neoconidiobolus thromboides FSU 785]|nr:UPF0187-domain-containing protein [Neoconidiobolus thromboides FSU 785]